MREIKFLAWDKKRKELLPVKWIDWTEWWVSCDPTYGKAKPLEYGERNSFKNEETDRHILMQFTGLCDKNGKEIYEDYILKISPYADEEYIVKVTKEDGAFLIDTPYTNECDKTVLGWYINEFGSHTIEVIGNTHENPELTGGMRNE
jgi:uncharacterized phage protein (TIGR01671 family)